MYNFLPFLNEKQTKSVKEEHADSNLIDDLVDITMEYFIIDPSLRPICIYLRQRFESRLKRIESRIDQLENHST
jgi:hypothetical protein